MDEFENGKSVFGLGREIVVDIFFFCVFGGDSRLDFFGIGPQYFVIFIHHHFVQILVGEIEWKALLEVIGGIGLWLMTTMMKMMMDCGNDKIRVPDNMNHSDSKWHDILKGEDCSNGKHNRQEIRKATSGDIVGAAFKDCKLGPSRPLIPGQGKDCG